MEEILDQSTVYKTKTLRFRFEIIAVWLLIFAIGYFFKIMHWPFSGILRIIGFGGFMAYAVSLLILVKQKTTPLIICNIISFLWVVILLWGVFFNDGYPFNAGGVALQGIVFVILSVLHI